MLLDQANIIRENRKTVKITIENNGKLTIICPKTLALNRLNEILQSRENYLIKKIKAITQIRAENKDIIELKKILLLGKEYYVVVTDKVGKGYFVDDTFLLPKRCLNDVNKQKNFIKKNLKEIAKKVINNRVESLINSTNGLYKFKQIVIGNFKSKWGSCDSQKIIKFNWKIIMLSPKLIDFIICHELTHLFELNHSKKFYSNLQKIFPDHKICRAELKKYSFLLNVFN